MLVTLDGIVVGKRDIGEQNCFLDILTAEYGLIEVVAHGVKKLTGKNSGAASLFSYANFCFKKSGFKYSINSSQPKHSFYDLSKELTKFSLAVYFADVVRYTAASEQSEEEMLQLLLRTLYRLEKNNSNESLIKSIFEMRLASLLGFTPDICSCVVCGKTDSSSMLFSFKNSNIKCSEHEHTTREEITPISSPLLYTIRYVISSPIEQLFGFTLTGNTAPQFYEFSEKYLLYQLGRSFKTLDYYKEIQH